MGKLLRLDKVLAHCGYGTRSEIRQLVRRGRVAIDGVVIKDPAVKLDPCLHMICVEGKTVIYREFIYLMLNKPAGWVSATVDDKEKTVLDLLPGEYRVFSPFPVGRLDKDTEGLLFLTNDGQLAHDLTAPKKKVNKTYYAKIRGYVDESDRLAFAAGIRLDDGYRTLPADLTIIKSGPVSEIELTITEGKYHQVKRMFQARDKEVLYLKRTCMAGIPLDQDLRPGECRELTAMELKLLQSR